MPDADSAVLTSERPPRLPAAPSTTARCDHFARELAHRIGPHRFKMWFDRSARFRVDDDRRRLRVAVPNRFVADWIGRHFRADLDHCARAALGDAAEFEVHVEPDAFEQRDATPALTAPHADAPAAPGIRVVRAPRRLAEGAPRTPLPRHRLDDFITGPSNELAHAAALRLADSDHHEPHATGQTLFLHGGCGLGKTHLLQGIIRRVLERRPDAAVHYTTGEQFTNDFLAAMRAGKLAAFRRHYRKLDLLAVDDVHFLANKNATQQEFLHSFDTIELGGARLALASDCHPRLIKQFSEALVSRCIRGLVVEVCKPDLTTRLRLIEHMAAQRGLVLTPAAAQDMAQRCDGSVRDIQGHLTKLHALTFLSAPESPAAAGGVGRTLVDRLFEGQAPALRRRVVRFDTIVKATAQACGVSPAAVVGSTRNRPVVLARALAIHLARQLTPMSYPEIAAAMGRANHSTVITAAQRIADQVKQRQPLLLPDPVGATDAAALVDRLRRTLTEA